MLCNADEEHQIGGGAVIRSLLWTQKARGLTVTQQLGCFFEDKLNLVVG